MYKLIACNVFQREVCHCLARTPHVVDVEFTELGAHASSNALRQIIQGRIDATEAGGKKYEAILLLYGLCGNATVGLEARTIPLVIPRAHDCCTILLGSKQMFAKHFKDAPSTPFSSAGYMERGEYFLRTGEDGFNQLLAGDAYAELVAKYGEEDAKFVWESMHPQDPNAAHKAVFIDIPETANLGYAAKFAERSKAAGKEVEILPGSLRIIENLVNGRWEAADFLRVEPGQQTAGVYDWEEIIKSH